MWGLRCLNLEYPVHQEGLTHFHLVDVTVLGRITPVLLDTFLGHHKSMGRKLILTPPKGDICTVIALSNKSIEVGIPDITIPFSHVYLPRYRTVFISGSLGGPFAVASMRETIKQCVAKDISMFIAMDTHDDCVSLIHSFDLYLVHEPRLMLTRQPPSHHVYVWLIKPYTYQGFHRAVNYDPEVDYHPENKMD